MVRWGLCSALDLEDFAEWWPHLCSRLDSIGKARRFFLDQPFCDELLGPEARCGPRSTARASGLIL